MIIGSDLLQQYQCCHFVSPSWPISEAGIIYEADWAINCRVAFWSAMTVAGFFGFSIGIVRGPANQDDQSSVTNIDGTPRRRVIHDGLLYLGNQATF
jgi:hypothetical protein